MSKCVIRTVWNSIGNWLDCNKNSCACACTRARMSDENKFRAQARAQARDLMFFRQDNKEFGVFAFF
jgi:hypothetical protein